MEIKNFCAKVLKCLIQNFCAKVLNLMDLHIVIISEVQNRRSHLLNIVKANENPIHGSASGRLCDNAFDSAEEAPPSRSDHMKVRNFPKKRKNGISLIVRKWERLLAKISKKNRKKIGNKQN